MNSRIIVFPGQGAQRPGMGSDFDLSWPLARAVYEEASDAVGLDLRALCFGDDLRLGQTEYTQPAILTTEVAMLRVLEAEFGVTGTHFGGHSLGEYTALVAAGAIPLAEAVRLVRERGRRMQEAVPEGEGFMAAILRDPIEPQTVRTALAGLMVDVANENALDQVVISGLSADEARALTRLAEHPDLQGFRARRLDVSAPFHSRLMQPIEAGFRELLTASSQTWSPEAARRVVSNRTGSFHTGSREALVEALTGQISGTVRWVDDMRALLALAPGSILEVGPNRPLRGFFRTLGVEIEAVFNATTARRLPVPQPQGPGRAAPR